VATHASLLWCWEREQGWEECHPAVSVRPRGIRCVASMGSNREVRVDQVAKVVAKAPVDLGDGLRRQLQWLPRTRDDRGPIPVLDVDVSRCGYDGQGSGIGSLAVGWRASNAVLPYQGSDLILALHVHGRRLVGGNPLKDVPVAWGGRHTRVVFQGALHDESASGRAQRGSARTAAREGRGAIAFSAGSMAADRERRSEGSAFPEGSRPGGWRRCCGASVRCFLRRGRGAEAPRRRRARRRAGMPGGWTRRGRCADPRSRVGWGGLWGGGVGGARRPWGTGPGQQCHFPVRVRERRVLDDAIIPECGGSKALRLRRTPPGHGRGQGGGSRQGGRNSSRIARPRAGTL